MQQSNHYKDPFRDRSVIVCNCLICKHRNDFEHDNLLMMQLLLDCYYSTTDVCSWAWRK